MNDSYLPLTFTKTRIAPTPSGYLHLGNILSFGITAALAKKYGANAKILLRIDDLDKVRANPLYIQDIFDTLNFLGMNWDEGPRNAIEFENEWSQLHRMDMYNAAIEELKNNGHLFVCTCARSNYTPETCGCLGKQLSFDTPFANWRIKTDKCEVGVKDISSKIISAALPEDMHNFIVRKKDGHPSYQLASVIDDLYYGVDLIVRGEDLCHSTLAQQFLARQLNKPQFASIAFHHHPLVKENSGEKLSKSAGATSIKYLRESGNSPAGVFSMILHHIGQNGKANTWTGFIDILDRKYIF